MWRWQLMSLRAWSVSGMILMGENRSTQSKTCPTATLSLTNLTWTGLGLAQASAATGQQLTA
jgi:hypothetical protein